MLDKIKQKLRPDTSVIEKAESFVDKINSLLKKEDINAECVMGGSLAKNTFLRGDFDVDLFVKFDYSYKDENLSDMLEKAIRELNPERVHGSRDYFLVENEFNYELVPVLDIEDVEKAQNVTDMSPLHVDWVKKNLKEGQEDEIRLAKKFCKASKVYGAESYIRGFSGHVIDILIIYYGSFEDLLKNAVEWESKTIIDPENYYESKRDVLFNMNQSKIRGPLIVIDPLMKGRNAASAVSYKKFIQFKKKAEDYLAEPSEDFFKEVYEGKTFLKNNYNNIAIVSVETQEGKDDVVGSKIKKAFTFLKRELNKRGFHIQQSGWTWNKKKHALLWFSLKNMELPEKRTIQGPPADMGDHVKKFRKKYPNTFEKDNNLFAEEEIKYKHIKDNLKQLVKEDYFTERVKFKDIDIE